MLFILPPPLSIDFKFYSQSLLIARRSDSQLNLYMRKVCTIRNKWFRQCIVHFAIFSPTLHGMFSTALSIALLLNGTDTVESPQFSFSWPGTS
jgi:hypothetical protein